MATWLEVVEAIGGGLSAIASVSAVFVARAALRHTRATQRQIDGEADAATQARVDVALSEYAAKFERAFAAIERTEAAHQRHEIECAKDKATLAETLRATVAAQAALSSRMDSWGQQMSFLARDVAEVRAPHPGSP